MGWSWEGQRGKGRGRQRGGKRGEKAKDGEGVRVGMEGRGRNGKGWVRR